MMRFSTPLGFSLDLIDGWLDITHDLEAGTPFTLARKDGVGAFQFSSALYAGGTLPNATVDDLREMLLGFSQRQDLGAPKDVCVFEDGMRCVGGSFRNEDFIRVWYLSDGQSFVLATYTTLHDTPQEVEDCERMIHSAVFEKKTPNQAPEPTRASIRPAVQSRWPRGSA